MWDLNNEKKEGGGGASAKLSSKNNKSGSATLERNDNRPARDTNLFCRKQGSCRIVVFSSFFFFSPFFLF